MSSRLRGRFAPARPWAEELVIHLPDGRAITTVINATPVRSAEGEVVSVIATIQDMTPLEELERLRAEFLGMVSHELRMPLTAIKGSAASALSSNSRLNAAEAYQLFRIIDEQAAPVPQVLPAGGRGPGTGHRGVWPRPYHLQGIVEAHGGRIRAESDGPGLGARFTFTIPTVEEAGSGTAIGLPPLSTPAARRAVAGAGERVRVLAVDDDPQALRYVRDALSKSGYTPVVTGDPEEALRLVAEEKPDLVLLDLVLPGTDGIELMKDILRAGDVPVIFLSAYGRDKLVARAFDMGAADYVVKPFSPTELLARIRAALRRREVPKPSDPYVLGDLIIDYDERRVTLAGRPVELTAKEYGTLAELSTNAGRVLTYETLLRRVWGLDADADIRPMRTAISSLRRKLADDAEDPKYILTQLRVGYRMPKGETRGQLEE